MGSLMSLHHKTKVIDEPCPSCRSLGALKEISTTINVSPSFSSVTSWQCEKCGSFYVMVKNKDFSGWVV